MPQIAQSRGAVDGRAGVVAFIAQLNLAGMHSDAQPDWRQRGALQLQRRRHRIRRAGERRHEAITFALFDGAHAAVFSDGFRHRLIEPSHRGRHLLGLALPEPCGALDVGQQQRHGARG